MKPKLNILICSLPKRNKLLMELLNSLLKQIKDKDNIKIDIDFTDRTIGEKRNSLLQNAEGEYTVFIDDDDQICEDYIEIIISKLNTSPDCCSLIGEITFDSENPRTFIHSLDYNSYFEQDNIYYRPPNHLNVIRADIAKQFKFPENNFGEDTDWAMQICNSKLLRTEEKVDKVIYYYKYRTKK